MSEPLELQQGKPCGHPGCLSHISHPCEWCGRTGGVMPPTLELQLPSKQYCEWVGEKGSGYRLGRDVFGLYVIAPLIGENEFDTIRDPRIVCSVGAIAWGREVKRLKRWRKACNKLANISLLYNRKEYNYANVRLVLVYGKIYSAHAQEAAWRERAEESEADDGGE